MQEIVTPEEEYLSVAEAFSFVGKVLFADDWDEACIATSDNAQHTLVRRTLRKAIQNDGVRVFKFDGRQDSPLTDLEAVGEFFQFDFLADSATLSTVPGWPMLLKINRKDLGAYLGHLEPTPPLATAAAEKKCREYLERIFES